MGNSMTYSQSSNQGCPCYSICSPLKLVNTVRAAGEERGLSHTIHCIMLKVGDLIQPLLRVSE